MKEITAKKDTYILCHNGEDVVHFIFLKEGNTLTTGQPFVEEFDSVEILKPRLEEITKGNSELFNSVMNDVMNQAVYPISSNSVIDNGGKLSRRVSGKL